MNPDEAGKLEYSPSKDAVCRTSRDVMGIDE
jgi:hypothetical protein